MPSNQKMLVFSIFSLGFLSVFLLSRSKLRCLC
jgi:hypothetical protein